MADAAQVTELLLASMRNEDEHFLAVTLKWSPPRLKKGHVKVASEMRELVDKARNQPLARPSTVLQCRWHSPRVSWWHCTSRAR